MPYFIVGVMAGMATAAGSMAGLAGVGLLGLVALAGVVVLFVFMVIQEPGAAIASVPIPMERNPARQQRCEVRAGGHPGWPAPAST